MGAERELGDAALAAPNPHPVNNRQHGGQRGPRE
jgi:hypothetical protein